MSSKKHVSSASSPKKRFKPTSSSTTSQKPAISYSAGPIPQSLFEDQALNAAISTLLPLNYKFEIHKTIHHVRHFGSTCVALQMPEGLTLWATAIADIIETFTNATTVIMGDVTYGACCVDDFTAMALGCDMLIHYGHSCLVPVDQTMIRTLYIFVEIAVDSPHLSSTIRTNFPATRSEFRRKILGIGSKTTNGDPESQSEEESRKKVVKIEIETEEPSATIESRFQETLRVDEKIKRPSKEEQEKENLRGQEEAEAEDDDDRPTHFALVATVQFIGALQGLKESLERFEARPLPRPHGDSNRLRITDDSSSPSSSGNSEEVKPTEPNSRPWHSAPYLITVPQAKPLSPGEVLGCTSPNFTSSKSNKNGSSPDALIYLGDGRFHLESAMIANPRLPAFRYDPYSKTLVRERYDHERMRRERGKALDLAKESVGLEEGRSGSKRRQQDEKEKEKSEMEKKLKLVKEDLEDKVAPRHDRESKTTSEGTGVEKARENSWGLILGTLGRQGSLKVLKHLQDSLVLPQSSTSKSTGSSEDLSIQNSVPSIPILLSELSPQKLSLFGPNLSIFVQTSCPRLSIDWGNAFDKPLLSPYEATVALGRVKGWDRSDRIKGLGTKRGELERSNGPGDEERGREKEVDDEGEGDYPMDFYSDHSPGPWTPRFGMGIKKKEGGGGGGKNAFLLKKKKSPKAKEEDEVD